MEEEVKNSTDAAASKAAKKGYSIWSLMVIMTLLAVWLAIPRRATIRDFNLPGQYLFFIKLRFGQSLVLPFGCYLVVGNW